VSNPPFQRQRPRRPGLFPFPPRLNTPCTSPGDLNWTTRLIFRGRSFNVRCQVTHQTIPRPSDQIAHQLESPAPPLVRVPPAILKGFFSCYSLAFRTILECQATITSPPARFEDASPFLSFSFEALLSSGFSPWILYDTVPTVELSKVFLL